jgi:hypothetical protein
VGAPSRAVDDSNARPDDESPAATNNARQDALRSDHHLESPAEGDQPSGAVGYNAGLPNAFDNSKRPVIQNTLTSDRVKDSQDRS